MDTNASALERFLEDLSMRFSDSEQETTVSPNPRDMLTDAEREQHEQAMLRIHEYHRQPIV